MLAPILCVMPIPIIGEPQGNANIVGHGDSVALLLLQRHTLMLPAFCERLDEISVWLRPDITNRVGKHPLPAVFRDVESEIESVLMLSPHDEFRPH